MPSLRFVSFGAAGSETPGVLTQDDRIVALADLGVAGSLRQLLAAGDSAVQQVRERLAHYRGSSLALGQTRLGPPIPDAGKIVCVGLNYRGHATEQNLPWPEQPLLFAKATTTLAGAQDALVLPPGEDCGPDYEVELVAVIGRRVRQIEAHAALDAVAGWMVGNDVTARRWQKSDGQWFRAKSCDTFFPCGPWLTLRSDVPDHRALRLTTTVTTGASRSTLQDALASDLIHDVPAIIAWISRSMTLLPGDLISTGTPAGVGAFRSPPRFLAPGDRVDCAIAAAGGPNLGQLSNLVAARPS